MYFHLSQPMRNDLAQNLMFISFSWFERSSTCKSFVGAWHQVTVKARGRFVDHRWYWNTCTWVFLMNMPLSECLFSFIHKECIWFICYKVVEIRVKKDYRSQQFSKYNLQRSWTITYQTWLIKCDKKNQQSVVRDLCIEEKGNQGYLNTWTVHQIYMCSMQ